MRILLIEPAKSPITIGGEDAFMYEPLALEYIGAGVSPDHDVRLLDMRIDPDLPAVLDEFGPEVVGITAYTVHVNSVRRLFEQIKAWNPDVLTVVGGHHATVLPADFHTPAIDLIVRGEGIAAFCEIVRRHATGETFDDIPGVVLDRAGQLEQTDYSPFIDLDAAPFPDRSLSAAYRQQYFGEWMRPLASIRTSKGCPFRCSFCALWKLTGGRYYRREPARIVEELAGIEEEFVFFADDESLVDAPRMKRLAQLIGEAGIRKRFFLYGRSDTIAGNPDLLAAWRAVGLERVFVGLEFFRDEDLQYINKGSTVRENARAIETLHRLGIEAHASFIVRPEFREADFAAMRRYCRELRLSNPTFAVLTPLPGTDFYAQVEHDLITHNWDFYDFIHTVLPTALPLKDFFREYRWLTAHAASPLDAWRFISKFKLRDLPATLRRFWRVLERIRNAHLDYEVA